MQKQDPVVMDVLGRTQALRTGHHFVFKSGLHCDSYCHGDDLFPHVREVMRIVPRMVNPFGRSGVTVVMGPSFGGNVLAQQAAILMNEYGLRVQWVPTAKGPDGSQVVEPGRGFERFLKGAKVLVTEDTSTTGESPGKVVELARSHGAEVVGVSVINSYGGDIAAGAGVDSQLVRVLNQLKFETYPSDFCPLCAAEVPIVVDELLGRGQDFQKEHPSYPGGFTKLLEE